MNMKENILFLRDNRTATGEVDKTDRTDLGKCLYSPIRRNTRKQENKRFRQKSFFVKCKENRQIIIKEQGSIEEDRQEEADVKHFLLRMDTQI